MKTKLVCSTLVAAGLLVLAAGCASPNPNAGLPGEDPFETNTNLSKVLDKLKALNTATAPVDPYAGVIDWALGGAALIGGGIAGWQNARAKKANNVATVLAQGVVKAGPAAIAVVQDVASATPHNGAVADQLNNAQP